MQFKIYWKKTLRWQTMHWMLLGILCVIFFLCLWLYTDIWSSRHDLQALIARGPLSQAALKDLQKLYSHEMILNGILGAVMVIMGLLLLFYTSLTLKALGTFREYRNIHQYILQSITRGVITVDANGNVTSCNQAFSSILGVPPHHLLHKPITQVFHQTDPILSMVQKALESREQGEAEDEITYRCRDGKEKPLRITTCALKDDSGMTLGVILLIKDLTTVKSLEDRLRRQERLVAIAHLTRRILHEVRNPLSAMDLNLQLLQERLEGKICDPKVEHYFKVIFAELHRLDSVINNTHLSVTPPTLEAHPIDARETVKGVLQTMESAIMRAGHKLESSFPDEPVIVWGDEDLLKEALINIIKNSLEAMSESKGTLRIGVRLLRRSKKALLEIQDTGKGIEWQNLSRIFNPYFTTKKKGTGLGLSIVHNIIAQHKGDIQVTSWTGEGTLVTIELPLWQDEDGHKSQQ